MRYVLILLIFFTVNCKQNKEAGTTDDYGQVGDSLNINNFNKIFTTKHTDFLFSKMNRGELFSKDYVSTLRIIGLDKSTGNAELKIDTVLSSPNNYSELFIRLGESGIHGDTAFIKYSICPDGEDKCQDHFLHLKI